MVTDSVSVVPGMTTSPKLGVVPLCLPVGQKRASEKCRERRVGESQVAFATSSVCDRITFA
jgi:hypothetical protein